MSSTSARPDHHHFQKATLLIAIAALALPLLLYAYQGTFARYMADDYCYAGLLHEISFWDYQQYLYLTNVGRYSAILLFWLFSAVGPRLTSIMATLALMTQLAAFTFAVGKLTKPLQFRNAWLIALLLAELVLFARLRTSIASTFATGQTLYWQVGLINVNIPLTIGAVVLGLLGDLVFSSQPSGRLKTFVFALLVFILTLFAGGLYETYATGMLGLAFSLIVITVVMLPKSPQRNAGLLILTTIAISLIISLALQLASPSTWSRKEILSENLPPQMVIFDLLVTSIYTIVVWLRDALLIVALSIFLPACAVIAFAEDPLSRVGAPQKRRTLSRLVLLAIWTIVVFSLAPGIVAANETPPARALALPVAFLVAGTVWWGLLIGVELRRAVNRYQNPLSGSFNKVMSVVAMMAVTLLVIGEIPHLQSQVQTAHTFAAEWDAQDRLLRHLASNEKSEVTLTPLQNPWGLDYFHNDPHFWVNACAANYYNVDSIVVK